jgi:hypothetical protein
MANQTLDDLKNVIIDTVKTQVSDFVTDNKDAEVFMKDRAERMAQLGVEWLEAEASADADKQAAVLQDMKIVQQSIQNEIATVAVNASVAARETFMKVLQTAGDVLLKALPIILAHV